MIDELPMLAALGPFTEEGIEFRDAAELRVKESDRIAALAENLRRMGARSKNAPMVYASKAAEPANCTVRKSSRTATIVSPWPSLSPAWPRKGRPSSATPIALASLSQLFTKNWTASRSDRAKFKSWTE